MNNSTSQKKKLAGNLHVNKMSLQPQKRESLLVFSFFSLTKPGYQLSIYKLKFNSGLDITETTDGTYSRRGKYHVLENV